MQTHARRHAGTHGEESEEGKARLLACCAAVSLRNGFLVVKLEGGEFSEEMSACRVNTSNQRSHPHLLRDQGASDAPGAPEKEKNNIQGSTSCSVLRFVFFYMQDKIPHV